MGYNSVFCKNEYLVSDGLSSLKMDGFGVVSEGACPGGFGAGGWP